MGSLVLKIARTQCLVETIKFLKYFFVSFFSIENGNMVANPPALCLEPPAQWKLGKISHILIEIEKLQHFLPHKILHLCDNWAVLA